MSLNKIKAKANKGKQKALPKLKAILANPNKTRCPVLGEAELEQLKFLLQDAIQESELEPRAFATKNGICLGLESSLRKINNQTSSCVFISLGIKPNYLVSLIARNAQTKDEKQPVFAQPKLENFIEHIFGIQALCMVFPKDLSTISKNLSDWVEKRQKPEKTKVTPLTTNKILKKKGEKPKLVKYDQPENSTTNYVDVKEDTEIKSHELPKNWSGDFISFGKKPEEGVPKLDDKVAVDALTEIIDKIPTAMKASSKLEEKCEPMEFDSENNLPAIKGNVDETDSDDFLGEYKALTVHKINRNPNKKPKKKRQKYKKNNAVKK